MAQIKTMPSRGNVQANHRLLMRLLDEIGDDKPDIVITPEYFLDGFLASDPNVSVDELHRSAIHVPSSPILASIASWARQTRSWVVVGSMRQGLDCVYNSAIAVNRDGSTVAVYDKVHLQRHENHLLVRGRGLPVFQGDFGPFGMALCADRRWPETMRAMAVQGARVVFVPTFGTAGDLNTALLRTRAFENEVFVVFTHPSQAMITGPTGEIVQDVTSVNRQWAITEIDLAEVDSRRAREASFLKGRHPDAYGIPPEGRI